MQPKLQFTCPVRWEDMRVGITGRHCFQCDKEVVDFTSGTKADLVRYLLDHRDRSVCGRVRPDQVDAYHEFMEVLIQRSLKTRRSSNLAFYLIAISGISAAACATPNSAAPQRTIGALVVPPQAWSADTSRADDAPVQDPPFSEPLTGVLMAPGGLTLEDTAAQHGAVSFPDVMPEFPGGQDSLYAFMKEHIRYPESESVRNIEGKVYVEFVIDTDGRAKRSRVIRGVENGAGFDAEVLRVIDLMPPWTPGHDGDRAVPTRLVLPVHFGL